MRAPLSIAVLSAGACLASPQTAALQIVPGAAGGGQVVLVMPSVCHVQETDTMTPLLVPLMPEGAYTPADPMRWCNPQHLAPKREDGTFVMEPPLNSYPPYLDPPLRIKLEFAGYLLAEAAELRVEAADRTTTLSSATADGGPVVTSRTDEISGGRAVAELDLASVRLVAASLGIDNLLTTDYWVIADGSSARMMVTTSLTRVADGTARWTATCQALLHDPAETASRLGNCIGDAVLATATEVGAR